MSEQARLIEVAFPLKQASIDSVHEKNVRHGHISTLHIWPARRPLAACRAALIATLLPDPGTPEKRREILERLAGRVVEKIERKKMPSGKIVERKKEETVGGILHWGRESGPDLEWFREEIRKAYGGRAPKVLDPFAGGGAIPLEAMRLGCAVTAIDINPVAWFILKCTLEYPQKLAGQKRPLPDFVLKDREFMEAFFKAQGFKGALLRTQLEKLGLGENPAPLLAGTTLDSTHLEGDLAWHVRAWGQWVLDRARQELASFYPTYADFDLPAAAPPRVAAQAGPLDKLPIRALRDPYYVYVIRCSDRSLYIGQADNLERRFHEHINGQVAWTSTRKPLELVHWEGYQTRDEAVKREAELKTGFGRTWIKRELETGRLKAQRYRGPKLVPLKEDLPGALPNVATQAGGKPDIDALNAEFSEEYLKDKTNPRWVAKPTVAYLWARTVTCKNCRATIPLLKTRWLCRKDTKRVLLTVEPNADKTGVIFGVEKDVPVVGGNAAQRREHDKRIGQGTMNRNGASCPCCGRPGTVAMQLEDIRQEGVAGRLGAMMTAVVVDGLDGKEYRLATDGEIRTAQADTDGVASVFADIPFGLPNEPLTADAKRSTWCIDYGLNQFYKLFTARQLIALGTVLKHIRSAHAMALAQEYSPDWTQALAAYLSLSLDRLVSFNCTNVRWKLDAEAVVDAFARFAIPLLWDYAEAIPLNDYAGAFSLCFERISVALSTLLTASFNVTPRALAGSACRLESAEAFDVVLTDPPYYDAISYSGTMDFFYVWLRRTVDGLSRHTDEVFAAPLSPKWDPEMNDGELVDDANRFGGDKGKSKSAYEEGMFRAFEAACKVLKPGGRLVIVFAHKDPDAWGTLVSAMIRACFVVDASWPIQTEMSNRTRALTSAALSSSLWLVCKKRPETARPGWDNLVLEEMREKIATRLREFWDAGIRGPDFVWAGTGPALEAYSKHPIVKKANEPGKLMEVSEFLRHVRRMVVDFVVGRVLSHNGAAEGVSGLPAEASAQAGLDDVTTYYLLHRHDFGMEDAPVGACILYAISCGLSDSALADQYEILIRTGGQSGLEENEIDVLVAPHHGSKSGYSIEASAVSVPLEEEFTDGTESEEAEEGTGSKVRLRPWSQRRRASIGEDSGARPAPLIDQVHRLMHLWKAGEQIKVDDYLDSKGLRGNQLFHQLLQALIELAEHGSEERSILESLSNHVGAVGAKVEAGQYKLRYEAPEGQE